MYKLVFKFHVVQLELLQSLYVLWIFLYQYNNFKLNVPENLYWGTALYDLSFVLGHTFFEKLIVVRNHF